MAVPATDPAMVSRPPPRIIESNINNFPMNGKALLEKAATMEVKENPNQKKPVAPTQISINNAPKITCAMGAFLGEFHWGSFLSKQKPKRAGHPHRANNI